MSLKNTMKLRMTISRKITVTRTASGTSQNDPQPSGVMEINIREERNLSIEQWQEKLEERIKDAEDFFHYDND